ncbi:MAG: hypothetical protein J6T92_08390 [Ottowia sp.]|nr:hypothetical protein [Ottowia sp.]
MPSMKQQHWQITFLTPAFLGNASQNAQWRTPPFKALLRQWWRVAWAADNPSKDVESMRQHEGVLFGNAWLTHEDGRDKKVKDYCKSLVRLRLSRWNGGSLTQEEWRKLFPKPQHNQKRSYTVTHPEHPGDIPAELYLGYGPISPAHKTTSLKNNAAIQAGESAKLSIAYPESEAKLIEAALNLMHHFGTLGGRSRNGWGSLHMEGENGVTAPATSVFKNWRDALCCDWPHAIGTDDKGALIWHTQPFDDWRKVMEGLAHIKIALRTHFKFPNEKGFHPAPEKRHWLSYPVTHHSVTPWGNNARLPNSLRFKVCKDSSGKLVGKIFHVPCLPPPAFSPNQGTLEGVWREAHRFLDDYKNITRAKN